MQHNHFGAAPQRLMLHLPRPCSGRTGRRSAVPSLCAHRSALGGAAAARHQLAHRAIRRSALEGGRPKRLRVKVDTRGDHLLTKQGRTVYLGAPSSACRQRLYDKAAELRSKFAADPVRLAQVPEHLTRLEAQVRPQTREARERFASIEPLAVMGSSAWLRFVWQQVAGMELEPVQVGKVWRQSDDDRAYAYLLAQYGGLLRRMHADLGSWACVGAQIGHDLAEREAAKRRER